MKLLLLIFFIVVLTIESFPQNDEGIVARIDDKIITVKEFIQRYELSPFVSLKNSWNEDSVKYDFFYSLVAEKLFSMQAREMGLEQQEDFLFFYKPVEEIILRDALFKEEIENKIKLSADDINNGIIKYQTTLKTLMLSSNDSLSIYDLYNKIKSSENPDSLLSEYPSIKQQVLEIKLSRLKDEETEDLLYSLNIGEYTGPIKSEIGWVVFQIIDKIVLPVDLSDEKTITDIKKTIRMRRTQKRYEEYLANLLSGITISADDKIFSIVSHEIIKRLSLKTPVKTEKDSARFILDENDYRIIMKNIGKEILTKPLFTLHKKNIPPGDFLASLAFKEFSVTIKDSSTVNRRLTYFLKLFIEEQLITAEAYEKKLNISPSVKEELEMWKDNYLAQVLKVNYWDSIKISDDEVYDFYLGTAVNDTNQVMLNLQVISLSNLDEISDILDQISDGKDFGAIIKKYGSTDPLADENGETGLKPLILLEELGAAANKLELNQVYGPVRRRNKYSLFRVINKTINDSPAISYEKDKELLRNRLRTEKLVDIMERKISEAASGKNFTVNENILRNIKASQIKIFVHRLMGFGGRISAVPVTDNWADWIDTYLIKNELLP